MKTIFFLYGYRDLRVFRGDCITFLLSARGLGLNNGLKLLIFSQFM